MSEDTKEAVKKYAVQSMEDVTMGFFLGLGIAIAFKLVFDL